LDPELSLARVDLRAEEESFFRWMRVLSLVEASAPAIITLPDTYPLVQLLIRLDPVAFAIKELDNRAEARITPVFSTFEVIAPSMAFEPVDAPRSARVLGPLPISPTLERFLVTCNRADAAEVGNWLKSKVIKHSSSKQAGVIQIRRDPIPLR
jgi:primosomal protein N' (replication factor Y)